MDLLDEKKEKILGGTDEDGNMMMVDISGNKGSQRSAKKGFLLPWEDSTKTETVTRGGWGAQTSYRKGSFWSHVGYAPVLRPGADPEKSKKKAVLFDGKGEKGRILLDFQWFQLQQAGRPPEQRRSRDQGELVGVL